MEFGRSLYYDCQWTPRLGLGFARPLGGNVPIRSMPVRSAAADARFTEEAGP
jgi:hypothetical protein